MSALGLTPEEHLAKACEALDGVKSFPAGPGTVEITTSLSVFASAHLLAAQVKMTMYQGVPDWSTPWGRKPE